MNNNIPPKTNKKTTPNQDQIHGTHISSRASTSANGKSRTSGDNANNVRRPSQVNHTPNDRVASHNNAIPRSKAPSTHQNTDVRRNRQPIRPENRTVNPTPRNQKQIRTDATKQNVKPLVSGNRQPTPKKKKNNLFKHIINSFSSIPAGQGKKNDFIKPTDVVRIKGSYDTVFLILVIVLTLFGLVMDFSASYAYAFNRYGDSFFFLKNQIRYAAIGFLAMFLAMKFDYKWVRKLTIPAFIVSIMLLIGVLLYGFAAGVAQRWITIGPISFQPSEIAKLSLVLTLALYVARNQDRITNYRNAKQSNLYGMFIPFLIVAMICGLVALEKHFSGTIIIFAIGMVVIFAAGARMSWFLAGGVGAVTALGIAISTVPYAMERLNMYRYPERYGANDELWQTLQGLYAVGSGGLFGVGLGNSRQKHLYVSQPQNDFVFSIIAEELGFAGAALVVILFMLLIWRGFVIALKAPDTFSSLIVIGLISKVAIQAMLNIAVVTSLIPNTGISLPFFSYGGTALMMQLGEMGIILSISRFSYQRKDTLDN